MNRVSAIGFGICLLWVIVIAAGVYFADWPVGLIGFGIVGLGALEFVTATVAMKTWTRRSARVKESDRQRSSGNVNTHFIYEVDGKEYRGQLGTKKPVKVGHSQSILVNPNNPSEYKTNVWPSIVLAIAFALIGGLVLLH